MKQKTGRKLSGVLLALAMVIGLSPGLGLTAYAHNDPVMFMAASVNENKVSFTDETRSDYTLVDEETTTFMNAGWYVVNADVNISSRITVDGTANLILMNGRKLTAQKGITVAADNTLGEDNTLNIYGQSEDIIGTLEIIGVENNFAGIGGSDSIGDSRNGGIVNIHGGRVTVAGGIHSAGIGGGSC